MEIASQSLSIESGATASWFSGLVDGVRTKLRKHQVYRQTMQELSALTARDLQDLGLSSSMFRVLAREAASKS